MNWKLALSPWVRSQSDRPRRKRAKVYLEVSRLETRWLMATTNGIVEYPTSSTVSQPAQAVAGADGNLWVTEYSAKAVVAISATGAIVKTVPVTGMPYGITAASDGTLWVTENGTTPFVGHLSTTGPGSVLAQYALPPGTNPQGITAGPDGNTWFVGYGTSVVDKVTPGGSITSYPVSAGSRPVRITTGSDGNLWVTESVGDRIARVMTVGAITEFAVPTKFAMPWGITLGPDGNLWITENGSSKIGRITTSGVITEFSLGQAGLCPFDIVDGPDGNLWITENTAGILGRITTGGALTQYTLPTKSSSPQGITTGPGNTSIWWTESTVGQVGTLPWLATGNTITPDPKKTQYNAFATGQIGPLDGNQQTSIPLDPAPGCSTCCCGGGLDAGAPLGMGLSLTDNSDTVSRRPIIDTTYQSDPNGPVPTSIQVTLTWNGTPQPPVTFQTSGHSPGDLYQLNTQVANPVTTTGAYPWSVDIRATLPGGNVVDTTTSGTADVVSNGASDPIGTGWSVGGTAQLISDGTGGFFWVAGSGGTEDFQAGNGTTFTSPPQDQGTLVKNGNGSYTYTDPQQEKWNFNSQGQLTNIVQPDGPTATFTYNGSNLTAITEPGGWTATFTYSGGELSQVQMPGSRDLTLTHSGGDLTGVTMPDGSLRTFTYDSAGHLTNDSWGTRSTTYTYDPEGALSGANEGLGSTMGLVPSSIQGLQTNPAINAGQDVAVMTDALGQLTTYTYDALGQPTKIQTPDGGVQSFQYDFAGQPTVSTDPMDRVTTYTYQYGALGNRIEEDYNNGSSTQVTRFAYDGLNVWADLDASDQLVTRRLFLNTVDSVTARISSSGIVAWYLTDRLGSVRALTNATGAVIDQVAYDGFGNIIYESNPGVSDRYLFTGREFDRVTGLQYNRARYYDPTTGRWTTEDPIGLEGRDANLYRYVGNDPTNIVDPAGTTLSNPAASEKSLKDVFFLKQVIDPLIARLGVRNFAQREEASAELTRLLYHYIPGSPESRALVEALQEATNSKDPEVSCRARNLLVEYQNAIIAYQKIVIAAALEGLGPKATKWIEGLGSSNLETQKENYQKLKNLLEKDKTGAVRENLRKLQRNGYDPNDIITNLLDGTTPFPWNF